MELKDQFTLISVISALVLGIINLIYIVKNRRNVIREHLYKEQILNSYKIFELFSKINQEIDDVINNSEKRKNNKVEELRNDTLKLVYSLEFILSNDFLALSKDTLTEVTKFYYVYLSTDKVKLMTAYKDYYDKYYKMVKQTREHFGIETLTKENETLHRLPNNKIIRDLTKEVVKPVLETIVTKL